MFPIDYFLYLIMGALVVAMIFDIVMTLVFHKSKSNKNDKEKIDPISHTLVFSQLLVDETKERFILFLNESEKARAEGDKEKELAAISKFHSYLHEWSKVIESRKQENEAVLAKT